MTDFAYLGAAQKIAKRNPEAVACRRDGRAFLHQALLATGLLTAVAMTGTPTRIVDNVATFHDTLGSAMQPVKLNLVAPTAVVRQAPKPRNGHSPTNG